MQGHNTHERRIFQALLKNSKYRGRVPSFSFLRVENTISDSINLYSFDIKKTAGASASEVKLDRNDLFVVTRIGLYLMEDVTAEPGYGVLQTYPNANGFTAATGFNVRDLEAIYNGYLTVKIGQKTNIEKLPTSAFRFVPETRGDGTISYQQMNALDYSYMPSEVLSLDGGDDITIELRHPTWSGSQAAAAAAGVTNKLVFVPYGFLIRNGGRKG